MFYVKVKAEYRWNTLTAAGMSFSKREETPVPDAAMVDEVKNHTDLDVRYEADAAVPAKTPRKRRKAVKDDPNS